MKVSQRLRPGIHSSVSSREHLITMTQRARASSRRMTASMEAKPRSKNSSASVKCTKSRVRVMYMRLSYCDPDRPLLLLPSSSLRSRGVVLANRMKNSCASGSQWISGAQMLSGWSSRGSEAGNGRTCRGSDQSTRFEDDA